MNTEERLADLERRITALDAENKAAHKSLSEWSMSLQKMIGVALNDIGTMLTRLDDVEDGKV